MICFDFNLLPLFWHHATAFESFPEAVDEYRANRLLSVPGLHPAPSLSAVCRSLPGPSLRQRFFLLGSVPVPGLRPAHSPRKPPRYRNLPSGSAVQALSPGLSRFRVPFHPSLRQRKPGLADLCRFRAHPHCHGPRSLSPRTPGSGIGPNRLRLRLHHHRLVLGSVSLGAIPPPQKCRQTAHLDRCARQHPDQCLCDLGRCSRCEPSRPTASGSGFHLLGRSRLPGLRPSPFVHSSLHLLHHSHQTLNTRFSRRASRQVDRSTGLRSDQTILLTGPRTSQRYPEALRRVGYFDTEKNRRLTFLTNNFLLPALTIAQLYRARWQVELFFRWIKQHLRIKGFYGVSENAVKTQVWIAISVYVLVAIVKKQLRLDLSLYEILQILDVTLLEKTPILQGSINFNDQTPGDNSCIQLNLFPL